MCWTSSGWTVRQYQGKVAELHGLAPDPEVGRQVWLLLPTDTALVLGSTQTQAVAKKLDDETNPVAVQRRRSGGAAVLLSPTNSLWVDVVISQGDSLWNDDVHKAPMWLGHAWARALGLLGIVEVDVCDSYDPGRWGDLVCFASRGPGEVLVGNAKAVGISQRRSRLAARFQCLIYSHWSTDEVIASLAVAPEYAADLRDSLAFSVWSIGSDSDDLYRAFLDSLPS